jgi:NAD(P)-dependent dehydrogenase (short-subunit alcohol dehydrogenase family)
MKTAVVAGGNSGVGKATSIALAKKGYRVIIHGRDPQKTKAAADEIAAASGNKNIEFVAADVSKISGMKELADAIKKKTDTIDVLVLSTGVILPTHQVTPDDLEMGFAIQYLSRFALVQQLMPELKKSGKARIVNIGAPTMKKATIYFDDISFKKDFSMMKALGQEMLAIHLMVQEFAKRNTSPDVLMNVMHVGIAKTGIMRETNFFLRMMVGLFGRSPDRPAKQALHLATDDSVNSSGYFYPNPDKRDKKEKVQHDAAMSAKLWDWSLEKLGMSAGGVKTPAPPEHTV